MASAGTCPKLRCEQGEPTKWVQKYKPDVPSASTVPELPVSGSWISPSGRAWSWTSRTGRRGRSLNYAQWKSGETKRNRRNSKPGLA